MAHYALQKLHILPSVFNGCSREEKAFIYASVMVRIEEEKKAAAKMKKK